MAKSILLPPELLREFFVYSASTGKLFFKPRDLSHFKHLRGFKSWNTRFSGKEAFTRRNSEGYRVGGIQDATYRGHRVIWAMVYGYWPEEDIDHVNGLRDDNRLINLREASRTQNNMNSGLRSDNSSGYRGVYFNKQRNAWHARVHAHGKAKHIGFFSDASEAHKAYAEASKKQHGEFVRG